MGPSRSSPAPSTSHSHSHVFIISLCITFCVTIWLIRSKCVCVCVSWTNTPTPTHTHVHTPTWCPIFLLAHQLLCLHTDACSVRRVCHRITMQPFSEQTLPPPLHLHHHPTVQPSTPSEGKHNCSCSLLKQPWQNIFNKTSPPGDSLCAVQSGYQWMIFPLRFATHTNARTHTKPRPFWGSIGWHCVCVCVGGNNGYYVPQQKSMLAARSLYKDPSSLQWLPPQSTFLTTQTALIDTVQTLPEMINGWNQWIFLIRHPN